ncbi:MAG: hypothetical protein EOP09_11970 [Proteobacteria bacterium]|nr:MAG: hypothetical protein EOP09_11970 [Pseudomonadota bacterium]
MKLLAGILLTILSVSASAAEIPRSIALGSSDFTSRTLGNACYGMDVIVSGLPCNPAFAAKERKPHFQVEFFFGNNISYVREVSKLVDGSGDQETVQRLFNQKTSSEMEASIEATFVREKWGLSYSPYRLFYYALMRNSALPTVTLFAGQEQTLSAQIASYAEKDFYWGLQLRGVDRKFILSEFTLTDALASGGSKYFETQTQRAVYLEPGILYAFEDRDWKPQVGLTVKNVGAVDKKYEPLPTNPDFHLAGSVRPPVAYGDLEFGVDLLFNTYVTDAVDVPRLAGSYKIGAVQALGSYGDKEYSLGFLLNYDGWNGGLSYWRKKFVNLVGERDQLQTVYLEFGFTL